MIDIMSQAKNAIYAYNEALKTTSSNIAGMSVTGYKRLDASFQTIFEKIINRGTAAGDNLGGTNPKQLGQGTAISNVSIDFSSGEFVTGTSLDLSISGQGLFILSPDGGNSQLYTRAGNFQISTEGNLTSNGMQVYGLSASNSLVPIAGLPSGNRTDYRWQPDGTLEYSSDGGTTFYPTEFRIALTYFPNPSGLAQAQGTSFRETPASGSAVAASGPGGAYGSLRAGELEQSNVFYLGETIDAMEMQRAMSGNLTVLRMASDMISQFISKLS